AQNISLVMLLPLALALAARRFYPRAIAWPRKLKDVTFGIWVVILVLIAANASYDISSREGISERVLEQIGVMALLVCGFNFGLGYLLGGRTRAAECSQALGQKNTTLSIYLALTYASPIAALGPTFYVLWHNLWNAWQLYRVSERKRRDG
ncbi:MAG TPA: transporter, partial [Akkermansia muciniphila]|nr:transporter [Akkermansia muciniphila]